MNLVLSHMRPETTCRAADLTQRLNANADQTGAFLDRKSAHQSARRSLSKPIPVAGQLAFVILMRSTLNIDLLAVSRSSITSFSKPIAVRRAAKKELSARQLLRGGRQRLSIESRGG